MGAREKIGAQVAAKKIGESGCYFLSIIHIAGADCVTALGLYWQAIDAGQMADDCMVTKPGELLSALTGERWAVSKQGPTYQAKPGELEILRFELVKTGATFAHFVVGDGRGNVAWDPWPGSLTVKNGQMAGKRIFSRIV